MEENELLDWMYEYRLVSNNKKYTRLLYKKHINNEDLYDISADEQKDKLRAIENREKRNPVFIISGYEKIIADKYHFDIKWMLSVLKSYHSLAKKIVTALSDFYKHISVHRNEPGFIIKFNSINGFEDKESLFFNVMSDSDLVVSQTNNNLRINDYYSDSIYHYPVISSDIIKIETLKWQVKTLDQLGKPLFWGMVYFELMSENIGNEKSVRSFDILCWQALRTYNTELTLADDILKDATKAKAEMDYWGEPTSYSTRYSDSRYYMYKREYLDAMNRADLFIKASRRSKIKLDTMVSKLDTTKQIGWEVVHNYRFTIHDGVPVTEQNRFVFDMDFSRIIINEDSYHTKSFRKVLESH